MQLARCARMPLLPSRMIGDMAFDMNIGMRGGMRAVMPGTT